MSCSCSVGVLVDTTTRSWCRTARAIDGTRYARLFPVPVPASTTSVPPRAWICATASSICSCGSRGSYSGGRPARGPSRPRRAVLSAGSSGGGPPRLSPGRLDNLVRGQAWLGVGGRERIREEACDGPPVRGDQGEHRLLQ